MSVRVSPLVVQEKWAAKTYNICAVYNYGRDLQQVPCSAFVSFLNSPSPSLSFFPALTLARCPTVSYDCLCVHARGLRA